MFMIKEKELNTQSAGQVKTPILHHINLKTIRMQEMIEWYGKVIGGRKHFQDSVIGFISNDGANHRIALITTPSLKDDPERERHIGMHHTAFEFPKVDDLLETWVRLHNQGIDPHMCLDHGITISFYYVDPDGNSVELQADWFGSWEKSTEFMKTSPLFAAGPIGKFVEPSKMVEARFGGMTLEELHRVAYSGGFEPANPQDLRIAM
jgi:catechol 2,3-dioxygenase